MCQLAVVPDNSRLEITDLTAEEAFGDVAPGECFHFVSHI